MKTTLICSLFIAIFLYNCTTQNNDVKTVVCDLKDNLIFRNHDIYSVSDYIYDFNDNLLVVDKADCYVKKFDKNNNLIGTIGFGKGNGPGEFIYPKKIEVDSLGHIYILDVARKKMDVFFNTDLVNTIYFYFIPAEIIVRKPLEFFVIGFPNTYEGSLIYKYNLNLSNKPILKFCKREYGPYSKDSTIINMAGNSGRLLLDKQGNIIFSSFFPYIVRKYSPNGVLLSKLFRKVDYFKPPKKNNDNHIRFDSGNFGLVNYGKNRIINVSKDLSDNKYYFDIIDNSSNKMNIVKTYVVQSNKKMNDFLSFKNDKILFSTFDSTFTINELELCL